MLVELFKTFLSTTYHNKTLITDWIETSVSPSRLTLKPFHINNQYLDHELWIIDLKGLRRIKPEQE
jgi:hypothetical protein